MDCYNCDCWDSEREGCTMSSCDRNYACSNEKELDPFDLLPHERTCENCAYTIQDERCLPKGSIMPQCYKGIREKLRNADTSNR